MPTFENMAGDADEVQTALHTLAHAPRSIDDPHEIYSVLASLTSAVASMSQALHQIAEHHNGRHHNAQWAPTDSPKARSATYRV